jgi:hypothetical protein
MSHSNRRLPFLLGLALAGAGLLRASEPEIVFRNDSEKPYTITFPVIAGETAGDGKAFSYRETIQVSGISRNGNLGPGTSHQLPSKTTTVFKWKRSGETPAVRTVEVKDSGQPSRHKTLEWGGGDVTFVVPQGDPYTEEHHQGKVLTIDHARRVVTLSGNAFLAAAPPPRAGGKAEAEPVGRTRSGKP